MLSTTKSDATLHSRQRTFVSQKSITRSSTITVPERKKIVIVGDGATGKTCFLAYYSQKTFLDEYIPTVFENITMNATIKDKKYELALWDTAGQDDYARLRPVSYPDTDVFLVCFAIDNKTSFQHVEEVWIKEVRHYCGDVSIVLVGLKSDLRDNPHYASHCVPFEQAQRLRDVGIVQEYVECSAKAGGKNIQLAVEIATVTAISSFKRDVRKKKCSIL